MAVAQLHQPLRSRSDKLDDPGAFELAKGWIYRGSAERGTTGEFTSRQ